MLSVNSYFSHNNRLIQMSKHFIIYLFDTIGTSKLRNFENNIGSLTVKLTEHDLKEISDAVPVNEIAGEQEYDSLSKYSGSLQLHHQSNCR